MVGKFVAGNNPETRTTNDRGSISNNRPEAIIESSQINMTTTKSNQHISMVDTTRLKC